MEVVYQSMVVLKEMMAKFIFGKTGIDGMVLVWFKEKLKLKEIKKTTEKNIKAGKISRIIINMGTTTMVNTTSTIMSINTFMNTVIPTTTTINEQYDFI